MLFKGISKRYKHMQRYRKIVEVLIKHGFGYLIEAMDLYQFVPLRKRIKKLSSSDKSEECKARRFRNVLEELGPTFIKLGQLLSTRTDIMPPRYIEELEKLQDQVSAMDFDKVVEQLESELGSSYDDYFKEFSPKVLASASIGQVHKAITNDGKEVVVKIQRMEIESIVETDLEIMANLASLMETRVFKDSFISPVEIVNNFSEMIKKELDYRVEGRNADKFKNNFSQESKVKIPEIFWDLTSRRVLTMEFIKGKKIGKLRDDDKNRELATVISKSFMKQIFLDGFFHGDPHPGNIIITSDNRLALIDFGLVGRISKDDREEIATLFIALIKKDIDRAITQLLELGVVTKEIDMKALQRDSYRLVDDYYGLSLEEIDLAVVINRMLRLAFKYKIRLPIEFILIGKSLMTIEGIVSKIDPKFNILKVARPFLYDILKEKYNPKRLIEETYKKVYDIGDVIAKLPTELHKVLKMIEDDTLEIKLRHIGINNLISKLDIITNRLSISVIISALIIGSSLIMLIDKGPTFLGFPVVGISGYLIAALLGIWLVFSIIRSGRF